MIDIALWVNIATFVTLVVGGIIFTRKWMRDIAAQVVGELRSTLDGKFSELGRKVDSLADEVQKTRTLGESTARRLDDHIGNGRVHSGRWFS